MRREFALTRRETLASAGGLGLCLIARAAQGSERPEKLVFVFSRPEANPRTQWLVRLYTEALRRLGIAFEFLDVPPSRATALSSAGLVDGELGRTREFADLYPTLVRVEEPNNDVLFSAYAMTKLADVIDWSDLRRSSKALGYRAGIKEIEGELRRQVYQGRTTTVNLIASGLTMLQLGRVDLYLDVQQAVDDYLLSSDADLDLLPGARPMPVAVLQRTTGHAYLHERHRALASELSAILWQMKTEGLHARYLADSDPPPRGFSNHLARPEAPSKEDGPSGR